MSHMSQLAILSNTPSAVKTSAHSMANCRGEVLFVVCLVYLVYPLIQRWWKVQVAKLKDQVIKPIFNLLSNQEIVKLVARG